MNLPLSPIDIYIWGSGRKGQLGLGYERDYCSEPTLLDTDTDDKLEWIQIVCGGEYTVGLTKKGEVFTWGDNDSGQLGHGDRKERRIPTKVLGLDGLVITKISCGDHHMDVLTDKGEILTRGDGWRLGHNNYYDQLAPLKVDALADEVIVDVASGVYHTCAVTSTGSIFTWGTDTRTGHSTSSILKPKLVLQDLSSKGVVSVSASNKHTACITKTGEVFTWGNGRFGKLGHGDQTNQHIPKCIEALVGVRVTMVSCGEFHTAVCTEDGHVYTFGYGRSGQLGHGDKEDQSYPVLVQALEGRHITQVQCGSSYTMALTSSGYVFAWGNDCLVTFFILPCLVEELREHNVVQISSGSDHCAVLVHPIPSPIRECQQASFNNKEISDVVFMVENQPLYANVDVLTQKSDYFAAMFRSNMRESIERVVQVPNCSKAAFLHVLEYLYLDGYTVSIYDAVELWVLADMYQLEGLKYSCMLALERGLLWDVNVSNILQEVEDLSCPCDELKRICQLEDVTKQQQYDHAKSCTIC